MKPTTLEMGTTYRVGPLEIKYEKVVPVRKSSMTFWTVSINVVDIRAVRRYRGDDSPGSAHITFAETPQL